ncbi:MAG: hypothetical protein AB8I08_07500 [Sandaracinaceae bacterium]
MRRLIWMGSVALLLAACDGGGLPEGWQATPDGDGPGVVWNLEAEPLPEIPLPNDVATWPDPSSPTGRRVNASLVAPSGMERRLRQEFDRLDGWGTFAPVTVSFDARLDLEALVARQGRNRWTAADFARHAVYVVDLTTGVPVPLDVDSGRFPIVVASPNDYYANDPRRGESNLLFETVDEDLNGNGELDPGEDTDFDGVLDAPNTLSGTYPGVAPNEDVDRIISFYERETDTLSLRPVVPLLENREYAVVLTDRLVGQNGAPVRSPFPSVHHDAQRNALAALPEIFSQNPHLYGDLSGRGWDGVAFAWTFTTQSTRADLVALREGLYGRGPFAALADEFPPRLVPAPLRGASRGSACDVANENFIVTPAELRVALQELPLDGLGFPVSQFDALLDQLEASVSHFAIGFFESPYLLGDPDAESPNDTWRIDRQTGEARVDRDLVPMFIVVPKETETHQQPFQTTLYAHGYGSLNIEAIAFAGLVANQGIATVSIDAQGHGIPLGNSLRTLLEAVLGTNCLAPMGRALAIDRARDLNGDDTADSAGFFFSAYMFHTRDAIRQSSLDWLQAVRILRQWGGHPDFPDGRPWGPGEVMGRDGRPIVFEGDVNGDGEADLEGDFDGDGVPDVGGWDVPYGQWGSSLGGIMSMVNAGVEPAIQAAAPVSGGAGLFDVGLRTSLGSARNPIWLRVMGPIVASRPVTEGPDASTACEAGSRSVYFELPDLDSVARVEIGCVPDANLTEGDIVVLRNLRNGESGCAGVGDEGTFRTQVPSDVGDRLTITVHRGGEAGFDYGACAFEDEPSPVIDVIREWRSGNGTTPGTCANCARFQTTVYEAGDALVSPAEGLGLRRQSPDLRRLAALAQIALDPGDPVNYARHMFLDPATAEDVPSRTRSVMVLSTAGDNAVPPAASFAYARAAGVLAFLPPGAPDELADHRAPAWVADMWGEPSPDDVLINMHAVEGLARLERHPVEGTRRFIVDVDDFSGGQQFFSDDGRRQLAEADGGLRPVRVSPPLRWGRESRPAVDAMNLDPWGTDRGFRGVSIVLNPMTVPHGQHVLLPIDPTKVFDESVFLLNALGWYLGSGGTELAWQELEDPFCLESSSCARP